MRTGRTKRLAANTIIPVELYVTRDADRQAQLNVLSMGRPGYVLVSRQMGKTNLLIHTKRTLEDDRRIFAYIDLSNKAATSRECFQNIIDVLLETHRSKLGCAANAIHASRKVMALSPHKSFESEIILLLNCFPGMVIIVLDEIDALIDCDYSDEILAQIRSVYFKRVNYPQFERLSFLLSGVVDPSSLIKDRTKSPFNIGEKIYLDDFTRAEFDEFIRRAGLTLTELVKERIYWWVGGHPRMTWDICSALEDLPDQSSEILEADVDKVVNRLYLARYDLPPIDHIRDLVRSDRTILRAIRQLHQQPHLPIGDTIKRKLYLAGILGSEAFTEALEIKNKVVKASVSEQWLDSIEPLGYALAQMGQEQQSLGNYAEAIRHFNEFLNRDDITDSLNRCLILKQLGECYQGIGDWDRAITSYNRVLADTLSIEKDVISAIKIQVGCCYFAKEQYRQASEYFLQVSNEVRTGIIRWKALLNYSAALQAMEPEKNDQQCLQTYSDILRDIEKHFDSGWLGIREVQTMAHINSAEIFMRTGRADDARLHLEHALRVQSGNDFKPFLLLRLSECEVDESKRQQWLVKAAYIVVENRLPMKPIITLASVYPRLEFDLLTFGRLIFSLLENEEYEAFKCITTFARANYLSMREIRSELQMVLWLFGVMTKHDVAPHSVRAIKYLLTKPDAYHSDDLVSLYLASKLIVVNQHYRQQSNAEDLNSYFTYYDRMRTRGHCIDLFDMKAFLAGVLFYRQLGNTTHALAIARKICKSSGMSLPEMRCELFVFYFFMAQMQTRHGLMADSQRNAKIALEIIAMRSEQSKSMLSLTNEDIETIKKDASAILEGNRLMSGVIGPVRQTGRNDLCPCGSGEKYKWCCGE